MKNSMLSTCNYTAVHGAYMCIRKYNYSATHGARAARVAGASVAPGPEDPADPSGPRAEPR